MNDDPVKEIRSQSDTVVAALQGDIDMHQAPEVHRALVQAVADKPRKLVINLQEVTYMDSSGIGTLVEIFRRMHSHGGQFVLCGLNDRVQSVFEITKLDKFFKIVKTEQEALAP